MSRRYQGADWVSRVTEAMSSFAAAVWGCPLEVVDGFMDAPQGTLFLGSETLGSTLYVREAYIALYDKLEALKKEDRAHAVITGNPGLGKSSFAPWVLVRWLGKKIPVLWHRDKTFYLFENGAVRYLLAREAQQVLTLGKIPGLRYIPDGTSPLKADPHVEQSFVAHSPDRSKYKQYMKPRNHLPSQLWMPFWEPHELEALRVRCFEGQVTHEEMQQLIGQYGAVPRLVLDAANDVEGLAITTREAMIGLSIEDIIYSGPNTTSHRIAAVQPTGWRKGDFTNYKMEFLSPLIARMVAEKVLMKAAVLSGKYRHLIAVLLRESPRRLGGALAASFLGSVTTGILLRGGSFRARVCPRRDSKGLSDDALLLPASPGFSNLSETALADSTSAEPSDPSSSSAHDAASKTDSDSAGSQASASSGGSALGLHGRAEAGSEGTLLLPELTEWYFNAVDDLQHLPAGDRWLQPPLGLSALDGIAIVGKTAHLMQITRNPQHEISDGLLSVLACLPKDLSVNFVWALPECMWEHDDFNAKPVPSTASLQDNEHAMRALMAESKKLVEERLKACETQYKIAIPIPSLLAEPWGLIPAQSQRPKQPRAALSMGLSIAKHPSPVPRVFPLVAHARTLLRSVARPQPALPHARPLFASHTQAVHQPLL